MSRSNVVSQKDPVRTATKAQRRDHGTEAQQPEARRELSVVLSWHSSLRSIVPFRMPLLLLHK
jgi:hypothetical protein